MITPMRIPMVLTASPDNTQDFSRRFLEQARHKQTLGFAWALRKREAKNKAILSGGTDFMFTMNWRSFWEYTHENTHDDSRGVFSKP